MGFLRDLQRSLYLAQRATGDARAAQRGTLGKRVVRRQATKSIWGPIARSLFR